VATSSGNMLGRDVVEKLEEVCGRTLTDSELQTIAVVEVSGSDRGRGVGVVEGSGSGKREGCD